MFTCALVHGSSRKILKCLTFLMTVAAAAASVVLTVDITKRRLKKRHTWVRPLLRSRSEVGACDLLVPELRATDTFTRVSPAEFDFCCVRSQSRLITGSGRWRRPIPPPARVTYWSRVQAVRRDWLHQFQLLNISVQAHKYANEPKIFYDGIYFTLLQCYRSNVRTSVIKLQICTNAAITAKIYFIAL